MALPIVKQSTCKLTESFREVLACPSCGISVSETVGWPAPGWDTEVNGRVFRHPNYKIKCCSECNLYYKDRVLTDDSLSEYYRLLPYESFESVQLFPTDRLILKLISLTKPAAKILDFGCGIGRILEPLATQHHCFGVEINERACKVARAKGITILPSSLLRDQAEKDFDFVILSDVFEHLLNPLCFLRNLRDLLKPGGVLIISTGNADAIRNQIYMSHFWYFRVPGHLHMLSPKHLRWCAQQLKLELSALYFASHYVTPVFQRWRQLISSWAFEEFHLRPRSFVTCVLHLVPRLKHAQKWPVSPAVTCTSDRVVATFRKL